MNLGVLEVEADVKELAEIVRDIKKIELDQDTKSELEATIAEARISYDTIVKSQEPFQKLVDDNNLDDNTFKKQFLEEFRKFDQNYLSNRGNVRTHCQKVLIHLRKLTQSADKGWLSKRLKKKPKDKLGDLRQKYEGADYSLAERMDRFLDHMSTGLTGIRVIPCHY